MRTSSFLFHVYLLVCLAPVYITLDMSAQPSFIECHHVHLFFGLVLTEVASGKQVSSHASHAVRLFFVFRAAVNKHC